MSHTRWKMYCYPYLRKRKEPFYIIISRSYLRVKTICSNSKHSLLSISVSVNFKLLFGLSLCLPFQLNWYQRTIAICYWYTCTIFISRIWCGCRVRLRASHNIGLRAPLFVSMQNDWLYSHQNKCSLSYRWLQIQARHAEFSVPVPPSLSLSFVTFTFEERETRKMLATQFQSRKLEKIWNFNK